MEKWIIVLVVVLVLVFGLNKLPQLGRNMGEGIKEFKKGVTPEEAEAQAQQAQVSQQGSPAVPGQQPPPGIPGQPVAAQPGGYPVQPGAVPAQPGSYPAQAGVPYPGPQYPAQPGPQGPAAGQSAAQGGEETGGAPLG